MGELILCRQSIAANPFYIDTLSLNIYSLEELCYYMKNNPDLLDADFASRELCNWLGRELGMVELSNELLSLIGEGVSLHVFAEHVLSSCGYLTKKEIRDVVGIIESYETITENERKKIRADKLLASDRIIDAIYAYEDLAGSSDLGSTLRGDVNHNLGVCFARLFFFDEARRYFEEAYKKNQKKATLSALLLNCLCDGNEEAFNELSDKFRVPTAFRETIRQRASAAYQSESIKNFDIQLSHLKSDHMRHEAYQKSVEQIISTWKAEYNRLCKI